MFIKRLNKLFKFFCLILYLFYKINDIENKQTEGFDAATDTAITDAVKKIY
jgi:hypothetical protein